jgi:hypothetical protein
MKRGEKLKEKEGEKRKIKRVKCENFVSGEIIIELFWAGGVDQRSLT